MPAPLMPREEIVEHLMKLFRERGYDGASLADVADATGLGRSSMYHHFPGGKEEMALAVLEHMESTFRVAYERLREAGPAAAKLRDLLDVIDRFYASGRIACLLERLCASVDHRSFAKPVRRNFLALQGAFEQLCREAGLKSAVARSRAEDAVVRIEGALVLAAGVQDTAVFVRAVAHIRETLLSA